MKTLKLSCDQGSSPPHLLSCCLSRGWENGTRFSEKGHTWRVSHMEGLPSSRLLLVLTACNQHLSWLSLMMSSTVPLVAHVSFSLCSLMLYLLPSSCLGVYGHSSQECPCIFSLLSPSVLGTFLHVHHHTLKLLTGTQLLSSEPVDCHGAQCLNSSGQNWQYRVQPSHPSPTVCQNHWATLPLWDFCLEAPLLASLPGRQYAGCSASWLLV